MPTLQRARLVAPLGVPAVPVTCALLGLAGAFGAAAVDAPSAAATRVEVGVYQDRPARTLPALRRSAGARATRVISVYVTGGQVVEPAVIRLQRRTKARLLVTWMPDSGRDGARQPRYRLSAIRRGRQDAGLRRLAAQLRGLRPTPVLRPMPEPNTPWYAWSGTVNRNSPAAYVAAWKRVRKVVRRTARRRVLLMWAPYHRSVPDTPKNAISSYFPGLSQVDVVGTSGYNFGTVRGLAWTAPDALFEDAYRQISALAPKPFWIAETGSTSRGGSRERWIGQLARLGTAIPNLAGIVWFDVRDRNGDFRVSASRRSRSAFKAFAARARTR